MVSQWGKMDPAKLEALTKKLVGLGAKNDEIVEMVAGLGRIRQRWDDLFTALEETLSLMK